jgi:hypothetical protein
MRRNRKNCQATLAARKNSHFPSASPYTLATVLKTDSEAVVQIQVIQSLVELGEEVLPSPKTKVLDRLLLTNG